MPTPARLLWILLFAAGVAACGNGELAPGIGDSTFVAAMADLHRIERDPALDSAARAERRRQVLQSRGLTPERLERAARALADDPERAGAVWDAIEQKLANPSDLPETQRAPVNTGARRVRPSSRTTWSRSSSA